MELKGYCFKDRKKIDIKAGCCHPNDYCPDRTACIVHFMEKEAKNEMQSNQSKEDEKDANTAHQ